ncbi:MAG: adenine phosphoribosyltransferase, partial [Flavobacteriales bacterium]
MTISERIADAIRDVPDFPKPGIMFKDITPVLEDAILCGDIVQEFKEKISHLNIDAIAGVESRGF